MNHLVGPRLKLKRAKFHLSTLASEVHTVLNTAADWSWPTRDSLIEKQWVDWGDPDSSRRRGIQKVRLRRVPDGWSCLIGDFTHNLRSALNHMVFNSNKDHGPDFPIFLKQKWFFNKGLPRIEHLTKAEKDIVTSFQPFQSGNGDGDSPLWILHEVNIADKHKTLQMAVSVATFEGIGVAHFDGTMETSTASLGAPEGFGAAINLSGADVNARCLVPFGTPLNVGKDIAFAELLTNFRDAERLTIKPFMKFQILFGSGCDAAEGKPLLGTLEAMLAQVESAIQEWEKVLPAEVHDRE